jgi:hypothetical protein
MAPAADQRRAFFPAARKRVAAQVFLHVKPAKPDKLGKAPGAFSALNPGPGGLFGLFRLRKI